MTVMGNIVARDERAIESWYSEHLANIKHDYSEKSTVIFIMS